MTDKAGIEDLEALFREASVPLPPGAALMARVLADAEAETRRRRGPFGAARAVFAGWFGRGGAFAGLATAALAGVWIGWSAPAPVQAILGDETVAAVELIPDLDELVFAAAEGG